MIAGGCKRMALAAQPTCHYTINRSTHRPILPCIISQAQIIGACNSNFFNIKTLQHTVRQAVVQEFFLI